MMINNDLIGTYSHISSTKVLVHTSSTLVQPTLSDSNNTITTTIVIAATCVVGLVLVSVMIATILIIRV